MWPKLNFRFEAKFQILAQIGLNNYVLSNNNTNKIVFNALFYIHKH